MEIIMTTSNRRELSRRFSLRSHTYIWRALHFKSMSTEARVIRSVALNELGGIIVKNEEK